MDGATVATTSGDMPDTEVVMVRWSLCVFVLALSVPAASAQTLPRALDLLDAVPHAVPLGEAHAVALVPAGRGANPQGVLLVRDGASWSEPELVTLRMSAKPVSHETPDYVILFPTRQSLERGTDATVYARVRGAFVRTDLRDWSLSRSAERNHAAELKARLTERTAPKPAAPQLDWALLVAHPELLVGGFAALGAWLATTKKRKR